MTDIPAHRHSFAARSGDTHVIGKDGKAVNVDQKARDEAAHAQKHPPMPNPAVHHGAKKADGELA